MKKRPKSVAKMKIGGGENVERAGEEALAQVIAPVEILKQVFQTAYPKFRVSISVHRSGQILALNPGPDVEEGNRLIGEENMAANRPFGNFRRDVLVANYVASLRLSPIEQQAIALAWLNDWLDNVMTSVPELAICNGYEPNGISVDLDPSHVVHQNGLAVLRFLQSNCKEDPGVYWLYKSSGGDVIQLFDLSTLSKNHSSSANSFPLVVQACAHEQFARLILNHEEEFDLTIETNNVQRKVKVADLDEESLDLVMNSTSGTSSPVCQDPAPLPQTTTCPISLQRAAVHHVIQAIKSLIGTRQLMSSEQEVEWLQTSKLDRKLWNLVLLLGESYLSLGEAYKKEGKLLQALHIVELACSIYGSMPHKLEETLFVSAIYKSFTQLLKFQKFEVWVNIPEEHFSTTQVEDYNSFRELSSVRLFWAKVWLLVGDIYAKFALLSTRGSEKVTEEVMPSEIVKEVEMLKKKLTARSQKCTLCLLVSCTCGPQNRKNQGKGKPGSRGGIFKYLTSSRKDDAESNLLTALDCYEQTLRALLLSGCKELQSLITRKAWVWNEIGRRRLEGKNFKEAEEALAHAMVAFNECGDHASVLFINLNLGQSRRTRAEENLSKLKRMKLSRAKESNLQLSRAKERAYKEAVQATTQEYVASLSYYIAAETEFNTTIENGSSLPESVKVEVHRRLGHAYIWLASHLSEENTTAPTPHVLKRGITDDSSPFLSAIDAFRGALASYKSLGEVGKNQVAYAYYRLALHHKNCCSRFLESNAIEKANEHALLADENWQKSMECFSLENEPPMFLKILIEKSDLSFMLPRQLNFMLESDLSRFLECGNISEEEEKKLDGQDLQKFLAQLQKILKEMLIMNKTETLKKLYRTSLRATSLCSLQEMHELWTSES